MTTETGLVRGEPLIMALPNGRILGEVMPLLRGIGVEPEPAFDDPASRQLRFRTSEPGLDLIRVRSFDAATFVAFGAAQLGVAGNDVLMEFDYSEIYAPLDLDVGHCRLAVAATADALGQAVKAATTQIMTPAHQMFAGNSERQEGRNAVTPDTRISGYPVIRLSG